MLVYFLISLVLLNNEKRESNKKISPILRPYGFGMGLVLKLNICLNVAIIEFMIKSLLSISIIRLNVLMKSLQHICNPNNWDSLSSDRNKSFNAITSAG